MLKDNRIYKAQVNNLLSLSTLGLTRKDAEGILNTLYGEDTRGFLSPNFKPENLVYGGKEFSHVAADIMALNLAAPMAKHPSLTGLEKELIPFLIGAPDFWSFMRDKDEKLAVRDVDRSAYISMYGHLPLEEFTDDNEIVMITNRSQSELTAILGGKFNGKVTRDFNNLLPGGPDKVYVDSRYLQSEWDETFKLGIFDNAVLSMLTYLSDTNEKDRLTLVNHSDPRCISKLCGYN